MDDLTVSDVNAVVVIPAAPHTHLRTGRQLAEGDARGRGEDAPLDPQAHVSGGTAG